MVEKGKQIKPVVLDCNVLHDAYGIRWVCFEIVKSNTTTQAYMRIKDLDTIHCHGKLHYWIFTKRCISVWTYPEVRTLYFVFDDKPV